MGVSGIAMCLSVFLYAYVLLNYRGKPVGDGCVRYCGLSDGVCHVFPGR